MRLTKKVQYGLLFTLYVHRAGRATLEAASDSLKLSRSFLEQVARSLRVAGVIKSVRGPNGGYEVVGEPTVRDVFEALSSPVSLLSKAEKEAYRRGEAEERTLVNFSTSLQSALIPHLNRKVMNLGMELAANESAMLRRLSFNPQVN